MRGVVALADHEEFVLAHHDVLGLGDLVSRGDDEPARIGADGVVDVEREREDLPALLVAALADETADPEPLVDIADVRLVLGHALLPRLIHAIEASAELRGR